jgi:hypothetical protein
MQWFAGTMKIVAAAIAESFFNEPPCVLFDFSTTGVKRRAVDSKKITTDDLVSCESLKSVRGDSRGQKRPSRADLPRGGNE